MSEAHVESLQYFNNFSVYLKFIFQNKIFNLKKRSFLKATNSQATEKD